MYLKYCFVQLSMRSMQSSVQSKLMINQLFVHYFKLVKMQICIAAAGKSIFDQFQIKFNASTTYLSIRCNKNFLICFFNFLEVFMTNWK